jgi:UDP-N-acetyl-2-amino-2-deoxyglucuronate dehydrogenase
MSVSIGILGGGNISLTHARAALEIDGIRITAVQGHNAEKAKKITELAGASFYQDLNSFLAHRPMEIVLIGSPSGLHAEHGIAAARHSLHVLVEKPIDITTAKADALIEACGAANVKLGVFFQDRTAPDIVRLKELISLGVLGRPLLISASVRWYRPPDYYTKSRWRGTWAVDGGGALMNQGIHTIDLLLWLFGEISSVSGKAITAFHSIEVEDTVVASFEFANGALGNFEATTCAYPGFSRRIEMSFSNGSIVLEDDRIRSVDTMSPIPGLSASESASESERNSTAVVSRTDSHRKVIENFIEAVSSGRVPLCDGLDARKSVAVVSAIYESSRSGSRVRPV